MCISKFNYKTTQRENCFKTVTLKQHKCRGDQLFSRPGQTFQSIPLLNLPNTEYIETKQIILVFAYLILTKI